MKTFFKYFLTFVLGAATTFFLINQYAPLIIAVPEKDLEFVPIVFDAEVKQKELSSVLPKAKNIILLIGDGMGANHITAYKTARGGPNHLTAFDKFPISGFVKTHAIDSIVTDSASSATAYSTGVKTINRYIGMGPENNPVANITELLYERGYINAIISTSEITHATPASFAAHNISRYNTDEIATDIFQSKNHIILGGGKGFFQPIVDGGLREDDLNHIQEMKEDHLYIETLNELEDLPVATKKRVFGLFAQEELGLVEDEPSLSEMFSYAYNSADERVNLGKCNGFFIMAEGSQIDWRSHDNDFSGMIMELDEFNQTIDNALRYAKSRDDTLVVVTADHETGGLLIEQDNISYETSEAMKISWNTAVGRGGHTGAMVPIFAYGPGAENFSGIIDNTDVFHAMKKAIGFESLELAQCN